MPLPIRPNRKRALAALALAVVTVFLGLALLDSGSDQPGWQTRASFDLLHKWLGRRSEALSKSPVVIVYLDLDSFTAVQLNPGEPWPRRLHAQLVKRLSDAGARAVVFDIVFSDAGPDAAGDSEFAEAIRASGNVILAGEFNDNQSYLTGEDKLRLGLRKYVPPLDHFATNAVAWGLASHKIDDDFVVRRYFAGSISEKLPSLTWATALWLRLPVVEGVNASSRANNCWLRYYGPALTIPNVNIPTALAESGVQKDFFKDKIVFVGARPMVNSFNQNQDQFRSPFHLWERGRALFIPGVEIHATEMLNLARGDGLRRPSPGVEFVIVLLSGTVLGVGLVLFRPLAATIVALACAGLCFGLTVWSFNGNVFFPWAVVVAGQIPVALSGSWLFHFQDWFFTRRRLNAKIREQAALIDKANDAILVQSLDGKILYANPAAEKLYGWNLDALKKEDVHNEMSSPDEESARVAHDTALQRGEWNGELRQQTRAGQVVIVASRWTLIRDDAGRPETVLLINSDVTEKKNLEAQFLRTQRMNTIGTLAGGMAHDLNNALAPVLLGAQLLRRRATDEESRNLLGLMETSTHRGAEMVRQVLLFARGRGGEFERLVLPPLVKELEKLVKETFPRNITVERFLPEDLWPVRGNPTQLHQILLNLCVNARDAMPDGGKLSFMADNVTLDAIEAATIPEGRAGEFVLLSVSDTGDGMPPEVRARIFEPFFTTKGEGRGTGIGLFTVVRILKSHEGFLRVESEPGEGTTFEIFLPHALDAGVVTDGDQPIETPRGRGELILVVDDERAICELVNDGLASHGYRVLTAANGEEGMFMLQKYRDEVRLVITDGSMPVMDGVQTMVALRRVKPGLPMIYSSADADPENADIKDASAFLRKPFSLVELLATVHRCLQQASSSRQK